MCYYYKYIKRYFGKNFVKISTFVQYHSQFRYQGNDNLCPKNDETERLAELIDLLSGQSSFLRCCTPASTRPRIRPSCASSRRQTIIISRSVLPGAGLSNDNDDDDGDCNDEIAHERLPRWLMSEDVRDKVRVTPLPVRLS